MFVELKHALRNYLGQILGWGIGLALLGLLIVPMYDSFAAQGEAFDQLMEVYPEEVMAFFGDLGSMTTPEGWLSIEFFSYMPLIIGIFAIQAGTGLLVKDEEGGTLDLVIAHPVSRLGLYLGRVLAFLSALAVVLLIAWLGIILPMSWSTMSLSGLEVARPFLSLYVELVLFGSLGLLLSLLLPSRRWASMVSGLLLVASFFITGLSELNEDLESVAWLSPLNYYQTQDAFAGLNSEWMLGLLAAGVVFFLIAGWRFLQRDLRVAGEGGWRLRNLLPSRAGE
jgi:ABC-2 type transport system permease protein